MDEYKNGNWSTDDPRGLLWHEYAHALTCFLRDNDNNFAQLLNVINKSVSQKSKKDMPKVLSIYGFDSEFECISESVAEFLSSKARDFSIFITDLIKERLKNV